MHPIRLLILIVLFYILYRLIFGSAKQKNIPPATPYPKPASDTLEEDPICHTYIPRQEAITLTDNGKTFYFCSEHCLRKYQQHHKK